MAKHTWSWTMALYMISLIINWLRIRQPSSLVPLIWPSGLPRDGLTSVWQLKRLELSIEFRSSPTTVKDAIHPADGVSFVLIRMTRLKQISPISTNPRLMDGVSKLWHTSVNFFQRRQTMFSVYVELADIKHCNYSISSSIQSIFCTKPINAKPCQFKEICQLPIMLVIICSMLSTKH